jgi:hypothetical protein
MWFMMVSASFSDPGHAFQLGQIIVFDMLCHNIDRIPCGVFDNDGNIDNIMCVVLLCEKVKVVVIVVYIISVASVWSRHTALKIGVYDRMLHFLLSLHLLSTGVLMMVVLFP